MKKRIYFFICLISLLCASCTTSGTTLRQGVYESISVTENNDFSKAKYELKQITEVEYTSANQINVIKDGTITDQNLGYYSFDLYFYLDVINQYIKIETSHFDYKVDSKYLYTATMNYSSDIFSINESFVYDSSSNSIFWFLENSAEIRLNFRRSN